jgi:hypothetical protein
MHPITDVFTAIDLLNSQDPNSEPVSGQPTPKELVYGQRMSAQLQKFIPAPSAELQIAARGQHICRWKIPRSDYPMDRPGYKKWRADLAIFHGEALGEILIEQNYSAAFIQRVKDLLQKRNLKRDEEVQALEDVICLVFLEFYLTDFAAKHSEEKLIAIIQKTWNKMSPNGHEAALKLPLTEPMLALISKALNS